MKYSEVTDTERFHEPDSKYSQDCRFSNAQLEIIRYGEENKVDVSVYANPEIPFEIMQEILQYLKAVKTFTVRYTQDEGETIKEWSHSCRTKTVALRMFNTVYQNESNVKVIDIREVHWCS